QHDARAPDPDRDPQRAGDQPDEVADGRHPEPGDIARRSLAVTRRNGVDAVGLDLEKVIDGRMPLDDLTLDRAHVSLRWHYPDQVRWVGGAFHLSAFQTHPVS